MTTSKHTEGPWEARQLTPCKYSIDPHVIVAKNMHVCEVDGADDARLIAAAPELLEACKALLDNYKKNEAQGLGMGPLQKARAAIAKAEGTT